MLVLGLTGSIGMGKSTTARMFARRGVPVHDADRAVHRLYQGEAAGAVEALFSGVTQEGVVNRRRLAERVGADPTALAALEALVHPLVRKSEESFVAAMRRAGAPIILLDIPLLFETDGARRVDAIIVVSADPGIQRRRVLARPGMSKQKFSALLARQLPDREKRRRAHFLVDSGRGLDLAERAVEAILRALWGR
jgi:dephospho-CoA kinase